MDKPSVSQRIIGITDPARKRQAIGILIVCLLLQAIPFTIAASIQPLFVPYVIEHFHFSLAAFSVVFTCGSLTSAIGAPIVGKLYTKVRPKPLFIIGAALTGLGFMGFSLARSLPVFYLMAIIVQFGCCIFSNIGIPFVIHQWIPPQSSGKALGIAYAGGSLGNIFFQLITIKIIATKGITFSYLIFGCIALIVGLVLAIGFIKLPKQQVASATKQVATNETGPTVKELDRMPSFWMFKLGFGIIMLAIAALNTQYAEYYKDGLNLDVTLIGILGSCYAAFCLIGNLTGGALFDKFGSFKTMVLAGSLTIIAVVALMLAPHAKWMTFIFAMAYGLNAYAALSGPAFIAGDILGGKDYSQKLGSIHTFVYLGFASGSVLFGLLAGKFGFKLAWTVILSAIVVGYSLLLVSIALIRNKLHLGVNLSRTALHEAAQKS